MNIKSLLLLVSQTIAICSLSAQCKPQVWSFKSGEKLKYDIVYNWGFIWVDAGRVEFKAQKEWLNGQTVYHLSGTGSSLKKHDWFFKVRDYYNSWARTSDLAPIKYSRNTSEGKYKVNNYFTFDYDKKKIYTNTWNTKKEKTYDTLNLSNCTFDVMTAVYYARTLDFSRFKINQKIPLTAIIDNEIFNLYGRYLGKETIKMRDKKKYNCLKFSMLLVEGTMFKGGEDLHVWISDDKNRVPLLVEAKVLVGSVKAYFKSAENLKIPAKYNAPENK